MPKIRDIMTSSDPDNLGLIPFMQKNLGGDWDRFQLRPWNFDLKPGSTVGQLRSLDYQSGFRLGLQRKKRSAPGSHISIVLQELRIGYELVVDSQLTGQIAAAELALRISDTVEEWSCCTHHVSKCVDESIGGFVYAPNPTISSGNPMAWVISVVREFELEFDAESSYA